MAGAVVNYPLVAGLIAFAIAQSTKFFTTWQAAVWNILGLVLLRGSQIQITWTLKNLEGYIVAKHWKELPTELFDNAEDVDFFEADACPVDMLILDHDDAVCVERVGCPGRRPRCL